MYFGSSLLRESLIFVITAKERFCNLKTTRHCRMIKKGIHYCKEENLYINGTTGVLKEDKPGVPEDVKRANLRYSKSIGF